MAYQYFGHLKKFLFLVRGKIWFRGKIFKWFWKKFNLHLKLWTISVENVEQFVILTTELCLVTAQTSWRMRLSDKNKIIKGNILRLNQGLHKSYILYYENEFSYLNIHWKLACSLCWPGTLKKGHFANYIFCIKVSCFFQIFERRKK